MALSHFRHLVLAGGGNRCWWQAGFWQVTAPHGLMPHQVAAVSAGAWTACMHLAGKTDDALAYLTDVATRNRKNFYPTNLLKGQRAFPHAALYRAALLKVFDAKALKRIHNGPEILIQVTRLPRWLDAYSATVAALLAYHIDNKLRRKVHGTLGARIGLRPESISTRSCRTPEELANLILASSCTPPFTPLITLHGKIALDGAMVDNVPVGVFVNSPAVAEPTLVLLARRYARPLPHRAHHTYLQPSQALTVGGWDATDPKGIRAAFELGCHDGELFMQRQPKRRD